MTKGGLIVSSSLSLFLPPFCFFVYSDGELDLGKQNEKKKKQ